MLENYCEDLGHDCDVKLPFPLIGRVVKQATFCLTRSRSVIQT